MSLNWTTGEEPGVNVPHGGSGLPTWMCASTKCSVCPRNTHSLVVISRCSGTAHVGLIPSQWYQTSSIPFTSQDGQVRTLAKSGTVEDRKESVKSGILKADAGAKGHLILNYTAQRSSLWEIFMWHRLSGDTFPAFRLLKEDSSFWSSQKRVCINQFYFSWVFCVSFLRKKHGWLLCSLFCWS